MFKAYIQKKLEKYAAKYLRRHPDIKLIAVVGSVGKTTTKLAIGTVLSQRFRVRLHEGNHNAEISGPLALLGIDYPSSDQIKHFGTWLAIFKAARQRIRDPSDVDVIVQEVGSDRIGQIPHFGTYARPYLAVVTAVSAEHMEFFGTLDAVASEELSAANFSQSVLINRDNIDGSYASKLTNPRINTYGTTEAAEFHFIQNDYTLQDGYSGLFTAQGELSVAVKVQIKVAGEHTLRAAVAAGAVGLKLGMTPDELRNGLNNIQPVPGRMSILRGVQDSIIIDDTYNSSPLAAVAAIQSLYSLSVPQRIVVLGSMNELGATSPAEHTAIGKLCDPSMLSHVITVGEQAGTYLAPAARSNGCHVVSFKTALEAGAYAHKVLETGSALLFKGSQADIYLEEAVKIVLHSTDDESRLVRQSAEWLQTKQAFFSKF